MLSILLAALGGGAGAAAAWAVVGKVIDAVAASRHEAAAIQASAVQADLNSDVWAREKFYQLFEEMSDKRDKEREDCTGKIETLSLTVAEQGKKIAESALLILHCDEQHHACEDRCHQLENRINELESTVKSNAA